MGAVRAKGANSMSAFQSRMAVTFADGRRVVDWGIVWRIYFDLNRVENICSPRYQSWTTIDGDIKSLDVDFEGAAADARIDADAAVHDLGLSVVNSNDYSSSDLRNQMATELGLLDAAHERFKKLMIDNSLRNMKALQASVGKWELAHSVAVGTRDLAVIVLAAGGAVMTGGASATLGSGLTAMFGSNLLGNIGKVQDTAKTMKLSESFGKVTAMTMVDFTFDLVSFGVGKGLKAGSKVVQQAVVIVVKTTGGTANALIAAEPGLDGKPKSLAEATGGAYVDAVLEGGIGAALDSRYGKGVSRMLRRTLIPGVSKLVSSTPRQVRGTVKAAVRAKVEKSVQGAVKGVANDMVDSFVGSLVDEKAKPLVRAPICTGAASHAARLKALFPQP